MLYDSIPQAQPKRKLEPTMSTEITTGAARKKDKSGKAEQPIPEVMQVDPTPSTGTADIAKDLQRISSMCDQLLTKDAVSVVPVTGGSQKAGEQSVPQSPIVELPPTPQTERPQPELTVASAPVAPVSPGVERKEKPVVKKTVNKGKTTDLSGSIKKVENEPKVDTPQKVEEKVERQISDEGAAAANKDRRKSKILETAEKFQQQNNQNNEKYKKFVIPGVSVGSFKKDFEKKATIGPLERKQRSIENASRQTSHEEVGSGSQTPQEDMRLPPLPPTPPRSGSGGQVMKSHSNEVEQSGSRSSIGSFSLEEARRSMENSIALLKQAKTDSGKEVDQLCAKTEAVAVTPANVPQSATAEGEDDDALTMSEREKKLKTAREIISNAIPRLGGGIRRPPVPYGANGRTASGTIATGFSKPVRLETPASAPVISNEQQPSYTPVPSSGKRSLFVSRGPFSWRSVIVFFLHNLTQQTLILLILLAQNFLTLVNITYRLKGPQYVILFAQLFSFPLQLWTKFRLIIILI